MTQPSTLPLLGRRKYEKTHPWLKFVADLTRAPFSLWMLLGEARSKCEHVAGVPLQPEIAAQLHHIYLTKGAHATTAIEGNTLSEREVALRVEGKLKLPPSREYLGQEIDNVVAALNAIGNQCLAGGDDRLSVAELCDFNSEVLANLKLEAGVTPGLIRHYEVGVARYQGAPADDCHYLLSQMCDWLNEDTFRPTERDEAIVWGLVRAVLAHLYIAWIHPFGDGNGRTARLTEFKILISAGVPTPAAHLLSNHYNATRTEYYRQLDYASVSGGDIVPFLTYAVQGFIDGLREQLQVIRSQQWMLAWRDYIHLRLGGDEDKVTNRRRHLVLDLALREDPVPISDLRNLSIRVAADYAKVADRTLLRDVAELERMGLIAREGRGAVRARKDLILAFLPHRRDVSEQPKLQMPLPLEGS